MKKLFIIAVMAGILGFPAILHAQAIENACPIASTTLDTPTGSQVTRDHFTPMPFGVNGDPITGGLYQFACQDPQGEVLWWGLLPHRTSGGGGCTLTNVSDTQVVFDKAGTCFGDSLLTWDYSDEIFMVGPQPSPNQPGGQPGTTPYDPFITGGSTGTFWVDGSAEFGNITEVSGFKNSLAAIQQCSAACGQTYGGRIINFSQGDPSGGSLWNTFGFWVESWAKPNVSRTAHQSTTLELVPGVSGNGTIDLMLGIFISPQLAGLSSFSPQVTTLNPISLDGINNFSNGVVKNWIGVNIPSMPVGNGLPGSQNPSQESTGVCIGCSQGIGAEIGQFAIDVGVNGGQSLFRNTFVLGNFSETLGSFSFAGVGSFTVAPTAMGNAGAPTITTNSAGAVTWGYKIVARSGASNSAASGQGTVAGVATLDVTHFNTITCAGLVTGALTYDVYRTAVGTSPNTTGKIGSLNQNCKVFGLSGEINLVDNGLVGDGSTPPASNNTGSYNLVFADSTFHVENDFVEFNASLGNGAQLDLEHTNVISNLYVTDVNDDSGSALGGICNWNSSAGTAIGQCGAVGAGLVFNGTNTINLGANISYAFGTSVSGTVTANISGSVASLWEGAPLIFGGGFITNYYGVKIDDLTGIAATNVWAWKSGVGKSEFGDTVSSTHFLTASNCSSAGGTCGSASAGSVTVAAAATTVVVNTTAVTANSQIFLMFDSSLGTKLGVTCNATEPALYGVTARTAGTSFTITSSSPITNPACFSYVVIN